MPQAYMVSLDLSIKYHADLAWVTTSLSRQSNQSNQLNCWPLATLQSCCSRSLAQCRRNCLTSRPALTTKVSILRITITSNNWERCRSVIYKHLLFLKGQPVQGQRQSPDNSKMNYPDFAVNAFQPRTFHSY